MASPLNSHVNAHPLAGAYTNAFEIATELEQAGIRATAKAISLTRHHAMLLETKIKAAASGRPGPRAKSGDYRRSWSTVTELGGFGVRSIVGTNKPQGRRLEFGFVGADRLGRVFNQAPYPHVGPAADAQLPAYVDDLGKILTLGGN